METTVHQQNKTSTIEKRVKGAAIDIFISWVSGHLLAMIPILFLTLIIDPNNSVTFKIYLFLTTLIQLALCGAYYVVPILVNGKTVGKYFTKTKIVSTNGQPLNLKQILKRELIGKPVGILSLGAFNAFKDPNQKASWDLMADTMVVDEE